MSLKPQPVSFIQSYNGSTDGPCPLGFVCDEDEMANCTQLQIYAKDTLKLGDIHAGMYCPEGSPFYLNCPIGSYCPDPETVLPCPTRKFCPHKTALPEIRCRQCKEGATQLARQTYGFVIMLVLIVALIIYVVMTLLKRYRTESYEHYKELANRNIGSVNIAKRRRLKLEREEKIRPKLELIVQRIVNQPDYQSRAISREQVLKAKANKEAGAGGFFIPLLSTDHSSSPQASSTKFNVSALFDFIDADHNGTLSYNELNVILELNPLELHEFVRRMNELSGTELGNTEIDKKCFVKFFLDVLVECSHFGVTEEEATELFDDIAGGSSAEAATSDQFFVSPLADFLTDTQILDLFVRLRREEAASAKSEASIEVPATSEAGSTLNVTALTRKKSSGRVVHRDVFIEHYAQLLNEVVLRPESSPSMRRPGDVAVDDAEDTVVDITFQNLCLKVPVGDKSINVVDNVTGRLEASTMTALMGGSGAGKTSLLNALCGRAFYGETTGIIKVNGHETSIEDHASCIGFVPQDDIVYAELTVRENFMYSGKFQLPAGTPLAEIEELADATLASLGLSRVANSMVGDVHRRGVSGGEKKRVNIGLELMSRPKAIFLDEPTSGLDSSSAQLVMSSLKRLVERQGVTICAVIHQPRLNIFNLFDSLVLLGVGGRLMYHGDPKESRAYFKTLGYELPPGESVADWLIDVSSGRLERDHDPDVVIDQTDDESVHHGTKGASGNRFDQEFEEAKLRRGILCKSWIHHFNSLNSTEMTRYEAPASFELPQQTERSGFWTQTKYQIYRMLVVAKRNVFSKLVDTSMIVGAVILISLLDGVVEVTKDGIPAVQFNNLVAMDPQYIVQEFPAMFQYATSSLLQAYGHKLGVIVAVLVALTAAKTLTDKRLEFFRESGSGYSVNAYFAAVNVITSIEHSIQIILSACLAFWIRDSVAYWHNYYLNFLALTWVCTSWALLLPLLVPPNNVVLAITFFMAFFGLLFSGALDPVRYDDIYSSGVLGVVCGFLSPTRFFIESLAVAEYRCLPEQSGFTIVPGEAENFPAEATSFALLAYGEKDEHITDRGCSGWYWGLAPSFMVGVTVRVIAASVIHLSDRSKQAKRRVVWREYVSGKHCVLFYGYLLTLVELLGVTVFLMLYKWKK